ncbi:hypothetical protein AB1Y20_021848 [Prymnesium parvum]|uniref:C3H1-type domain-containing protein n=1 Tax=Prymnesium parvum TaxID=97485 RepID=A0AB34JJG8_PRYPA
MVKQISKQRNISHAETLREAKIERVKEADGKRKRAMAIAVPRFDPRNPCNHLAKGKCAAGAKCKFDHSFYGAGTPGNTDWTAISKIECKLPRRMWGECASGRNCVYTCSTTDMCTEADMANAGGAGVQDPPPFPTKRHDGVEDRVAQLPRPMCRR